LRRSRRVPPSPLFPWIMKLRQPSNSNRWSICLSLNLHLARRSHKIESAVLSRVCALPEYLRGAIKDGSSTTLSFGTAAQFHAGSIHQLGVLVGFCLRRGRIR